MKPNFALSLSYDGIRLLLRAAGGWQLVGQADVADPDLASALSDLRNAASAYEPHDFYTKLIIPDDQIRYLSVDTGAVSDADRVLAARNALEGVTPYPVEALAFDISPDGATTHVAAVARETLAEAEAFASEHAFNPICFVSAPSNSGFLGEPFFGPTTVAPTLLAAGEQVEADGIRVVIIGDAPSPDEIAVADEADEQSGDPEPDVSSGPASVLVLNKDAPENVAENGAKSADAADPEDNKQKATSAAQGQTEREVAETVEDIASVQSVNLESPELPQGLGDPNDAPTEKPKVETHEQDSATGAADTAPSPLEKLGFASRRGTNSGAAAQLGGVTRNIPPAPAPIAVPIAPPPAPADPPKSTVDSLRPIDPPGLPPEPEQTPEVKHVRAGGFLSRRKPQSVAGNRRPGTAPAPATAKVAARQMDVFGDRDAQTVGGKPRYLGLILMAALLIFLAGVAAWATVFMDDGLARLFQGKERTLASTLPEETQSAIAAEVGVTTPLPEGFGAIEPDETTTPQSNDASAIVSIDPTAPNPDVAATGGVELASLTDMASDGLTSEDAAVLDALRDPLPESPVETSETLDGAALEARYAVTGIWPKAPEAGAPVASISLGDLYIAGIDPVSPALDAVALPLATSFLTDTQLAVVTSPVAAGTSFALGENGLVVATVEGTLSPDGHIVYLGRPVVVPPATPVRFATDPTDRENLQTATQIRPRARPTDLIEQNERATLGGLSRQELAALRPQLRPQAPQEQEQVDENAPPSALAVAQSHRPKTRPSNFSRIVAKAKASPNRGSTASVTTASVAPRTVTPSIPSSASVSKSATVRNAINLRQVNLIGVFGTPSNRRALVRLSNGRYRKVKVGDRIDGGRVSAIGDSELRYQKGSRNLVLKMPRG